jgi:hypothetical protein
MSQYKYKSVDADEIITIHLRYLKSTDTVYEINFSVIGTFNKRILVFGNDFKRTKLHAKHILNFKYCKNFNESLSYMKLKIKKREHENSLDRDLRLNGYHITNDNSIIITYPLRNFTAKFLLQNLELLSDCTTLQPYLIYEGKRKQINFNSIFKESKTRTKLFDYDPDILDIEYYCLKNTTLDLYLENFKLQVRVSKLEELIFCKKN